MTVRLARAATTIAEASLAGGLTGPRVRGLVLQEESGGRHDIRVASTFGERPGALQVVSDRFLEEEVDLPVKGVERLFGVHCLEHRDDSGIRPVQCGLVVREFLRAVALGYRLRALSVDVDDALQREFRVVPDRASVILVYESGSDDDQVGCHVGSNW